MTEATIEHVRKIDGWKGDVSLVQGPDGKHFIVSSVNAMFSGFETLVFPADADGDALNYLEVAGGRGLSHEEAIMDLAANYDEAAAEWDRAAQEDDDA